MLPKTSAYAKRYDRETKHYLVFFIGNDELLETYYHIWNKVSSSIKKELDC